MRKLYMAIAFLASLFSTTYVFAGEKEDINAAFTAWQSAFSGGSIEKIAELYDKNAVIYAIFSQKPITSSFERQKYFEALASRPGLRLTVTTQMTRVLSQDTGIVTGQYTITYEENGKSSSTPINFSIVYHKEAGKWLIAHHHASILTKQP